MKVITRCHIGAADNPSLPGSYASQNGKLLHMARWSEMISSVGVKQLTQRNIPEDFNLSNIDVGTSTVASSISFSALTARYEASDSQDTNKPPVLTPDPTS
jgi:hypothetical protein